MHFLDRPPVRRPLRWAPTLVAAVCAGFALGAPVTALAAARATVERGSASAAGPFTLDIESDTAAADAQPDLSPLGKDFIVLGAGTRSETSIVDGNRVDHRHWTLRLKPRRPGALTVPAIAIGDEHTAALPIEVAAPSPQAAAELAKHVFLEVTSADAGRPVYVQQQAPYTVRLYYDDTIQKGELAAPSLPDAVVEQLGDDKHGTATRDGRRYNVVERTYAVSPEKSGRLRIPPMTFSGSQRVPPDSQGQGQGQGQDGTDPGDDMIARMLRNTPFANDPFLRQGFAQAMPFAPETQPVAAQSPELVLDVKPRPAAARGDWLPAEAIGLHDSWQDNPPNLKAGEPATRTITIRAKGLSASQIPALALAQPKNARVYAEAVDNQSRTDGQTIYGISTQKLTYIPDAQGTLELPAVDVAWWDVQADAARQATLPALKLGVAAGIGGVSPGAVRAGAAALSSPAPAPTRPASPSGLRPAWERLISASGGGLAAAALLALLLMALVLWRRRRPVGIDASLRAPAATPAKSSSLQALRRACLSDDAQAAAGALRELALAQWPDDPPLGLGALAARLDAGASEIGDLERCLYGTAQASSWQGTPLWQALQRGLRPRRGRSAPMRDDGLAALYPLRPRPGT